MQGRACTRAWRGNEEADNGLKGGADSARKTTDTGPSRADKQTHTFVRRSANSCGSSAAANRVALCCNAPAPACAPPPPPPPKPSQPQSASWPASGSWPVENPRAATAVVTTCGAERGRDRRKFIEGLLGADVPCGTQVCV